MHINDTGRDSFRFQEFRCFHCHWDIDADCNNRHIPAVSELYSFSKFKMIPVNFIRYDFRCRAFQPQISRPFVINQSFNCQLHFIPVARAAYQHSGNSPHQGKIFDALVGCTVFTYRNATMRPDHRHIQSRISDGVAHLLISSA